MSPRLKCHRLAWVVTSGFTLRELEHKDVSSGGLVRAGVSPKTRCSEHAYAAGLFHCFKHAAPRRAIRIAWTTTPGHKSSPTPSPRTPM
jgi:hypothetical protein